MMRTEAEAVDARRMAWLVVALLVPVALLNYLDRQMLAAMKLSMMRDLPDIATGERWGFMLGSFKWVYAVLGPVGGYVADRTSRRVVVAGSLATWSAVAWATSRATSYSELVAARGLMGISEAFYIPAALALIADFHPGSTRSRAIGLHQMGIYAGVILGGFAGHVADDPGLGWRFAYRACGIVGVIYALPLLALLRDPPSRDEPGDGAAGPARGWLIGELFRNPAYLLLVAYFTLPAIAGWVVRDWMPDILRERFALGQGRAGVAAVIPVQMACLVGAGLGGWWADAWSQRSERGRIFVSAIGTALFLPALFGVGLAPGLGMAVAFLALYGIGWGFFDGNNMPILAQVVRPGARATAYGVMNLVSIGIGGFADWGFGALRDRHLPLPVIFGAFAALALLSVAIVLAIRPRPELASRAS